MNPIVRRRIDQVRRRWWVVLVITVLATVGALLPVLFSKPTYVATSTLVLSSPSRNPVEDAAMAVGYSTLLNQPATLERLKAARGIPKDVTFEARMVAASPILTIEATAKDPNVAQDAAQHMAEAFRDDINSVRQRRREKAIQETQTQLDQLLAKPGPDGFMNPVVPVVQQQLNALRADTTDQLQELQLRAGVDKVASPVALQLVLGTVGGLLLGVLAALGLATMSKRLANSDDLRDKTGVDPLVEVPAGGSIAQERLRKDRLRTLANIVSFQDMEKSTVVALSDTRCAQGARDLAAALAGLSAEQGYRTVLVYADNDSSLQPETTGFNDALADTSRIDSVLQCGAVDSLKIMYPGSFVADRYPLVSREKVVAVLDELRTGADMLIVAAPPITDTVESQPICAAADLTMIVVARNSSRTGDVTSAVDTLADAHAVLLGGVLVDKTEGRRTSRQTPEDE